MKSIIERVEKGGGECSGAVVMRLKRRLFEMELENYSLSELRMYPRIRKEYFNHVAQGLEKKIRDGKLSAKEVEEYYKVFSILGGFQNDFAMPGYRGRQRKFSIFHLTDAGRAHISHESAEEALNSLGMDRVEEMFRESMNDAITILEKKYGAAYERLLSRVVEERIDSINNLIKRVFGSESLFEFNVSYNREIKESCDIEREVVAEFLRDGRISEEEADGIRIEVNMLESFIIEEVQNDEAVKLMSNLAKRRNDSSRNKRRKKGK